MAGAAWDLGMSVATGRPVLGEVLTAVSYSLRLALLATIIGFVLGSLFGFVAGYFRNSIVDRGVTAVGFRRQRAALLAGNAVSHRLQRQILPCCRPPAADRWRDWLAVGPGASAVHAAAGDYAVGDPDGIIAPCVRKWRTFLVRSLSSACAPAG